MAGQRWRSMGDLGSGSVSSLFLSGHHDSAEREFKKNKLGTKCKYCWTLKGC